MGEALSHRARGLEGVENGDILIKEYKIWLLRWKALVTEYVVWWLQLIISMVYLKLAVNTSLVFLPYRQVTVWDDGCVNELDSGNHSTTSAYIAKHHLKHMPVLSATILHCNKMNLWKALVWTSLNMPLVYEHRIINVIKFQKNKHPLPISILCKEKNGTLHMSLSAVV